MRRLVTFLIIGVLASVVPALAQMSEVSLDSRTDGSAIVVEARVLESVPFWSPDGTRILTSHKLEILKVLKLSGQRLDEIEGIRVLTLGGTVGGHRAVVEPSLSLDLGDRGVFFLEQRREYAGLEEAWLPVAGPQGFVKYDAHRGTARDTFATYPDVQKNLFGPIRERSGQPATVIQEIPMPGSTARGINPIIDDLSPLTVSGGVQEVLTITGSNFGASQTGMATVFFDDPDDGPGANFQAVSTLHVISWSDTQIQVYVPADAGTGPIVVWDDVGASGQSAQTLTIDYSLGEQVDGADANLHRIFQENEDARGGYTLVYNTNAANNGVDFTSNTEAVARLEESLAEWRCATGWTVEVDGTTTVNSTANDGVNIVAFDNDADALPGGVLGRATSWYTGCSGGGFTKDWHLQGIDVRFRRDGTGGINWFFGSDTAMQMGGEFDFKSVALHELGHAVQHKHVNNGGDFMFYSISPGTNARTLTTANIDGGQDILAYSDGRQSACALGMRTFDCSAPPSVGFFADPTAVCGTTLDVNFTDLTFDGPTSWDWSFGDSSSSIERNPMHTYNGTGAYTVSLDVANANGMDSVTVDNLVILTDAPRAATCDPTFTSYNNCCGIGPIAVVFNTIQWVSQTNTQGDPMHEDFTCEAMTVVEPGVTYPITVVPGSTNVEVVQAYIDWNDDGTFGAGELVFDSPVPTADPHVGMVAVPMTAVQDTSLRMRVLSDFPAGPTTGPITSACDNLEFGQAEDYSVIVSDPAAAGGPGGVPDTSLRVGKSSVFVGNIDFSWDASCSATATDYSIYQGVLGNWTSHTQRICSTGGATIRNNFNPGNPSRYYLIVPVDPSGEGSYGLDSGDTERPVGVSTCNAPQVLTGC